MESEACWDALSFLPDRAGGANLHSSRRPWPAEERHRPNQQPYTESAALEAQINTAALVLRILAPSSGLGGRIKRQTNEHISYTWLEVIRDYNTSQADDNRT